MTREEAVEILKSLMTLKNISFLHFSQRLALGMAIEALSQSEKEVLTDTEKRIFSAAMCRERRICEQVEKEWAHIPSDMGMPLVPVVDEIERKVRTTLW